jgi:hypothetical protein
MADNSENKSTKNFMGLGGSQVSDYMDFLNTREKRRQIVEKINIEEQRET